MIDGSPLSKAIMGELQKRQVNPPANDQVLTGQSKDQIIRRLLNYNRVVPCKDNSEDAASVIHLLLTISL